MKKSYPYLALLFMIVLSLVPPINFFISNPSSDKWVMLVLLAGFFGFCTFFTAVPWLVRFIAVGTFINAFFSVSPYVSFTSYISIVGCCWFYVLCTKIENWTVIYKALQCLLLLNLFLIVMQWLGVDTLLNFGFGRDFTCYGIVGQHMQMGSFSVVLCAFLISFNAFNFLPPFAIALFCNSSWTIAAAGAGMFTALYLYFKEKRVAWVFATVCAVVFIIFGTVTHKFAANMSPQVESGRGAVWKRSIELANQRPLTGWGIGTYKIVFAPLSGLKSIPYKTAHNWIIQMIFEVGYPMTMVLIVALGGFVWRLFKGQHVLCTAGLVMILMDMLVHFPERMIQCVLIIICFLAYCSLKLRSGNPSELPSTHLQSSIFEQRS